MVLASTHPLTGSTTLIDHQSYLGLDMDNSGCRADVSFINAIGIGQDTNGDFTCTAL
jgi:hypothetical protein